jgi:pantoate--beta-alanine ligase
LNPFIIAMQVFHTQSALINFLKSADLQNVGFVPTMGALHQGHLSLIHQSKSENDFTVCSIFVNPTQFNNPSDLANYPNRTEQDIELLTSIGCDALYLPDSMEDVYAFEQPFAINLGELTTVMEGKHRPGHFEGVIRVVKLLFEIVQPKRAYFGLKDYQQYCIIREMAGQLFPKIEIVGCETIREENGLAMSSRNLLLTEDQMNKASNLYQTLLAAKMKLLQQSLDSIEQEALQTLRQVAEPEYFEIRNAQSLQAVKDVFNEEVRAFVVAKVGNVRLIDNMALNY